MIGTIIISVSFMLALIAVVGYIGFSIWDWYTHEGFSFKIVWFAILGLFFIGLICVIVEASIC